MASRSSRDPHQDQDLLIRIGAPEGLLVEKPHRDIALQRLSSAGLIMAQRHSGDVVRVRLTASGRKLVAGWHGS